MRPLNLLRKPERLMEHMKSAQQFLASAPPCTESHAGQKRALEVRCSGLASVRSERPPEGPQMLPDGG